MTRLSASKGWGWRHSGNAGGHLLGALEPLGQSDKRGAMLLAGQKFPMGACLKSKKKVRKEKNKSSRNFKMRNTPPLYTQITFCRNWIFISSKGKFYETNSLPIMALKDFYFLPVTESSDMGTFPSDNELQEKEVAHSIQKQSVLALPTQGPEGEGEVLTNSTSQASTTVQAHGPDKLVSKRAAPAT